MGLGECGYEGCGLGMGERFAGAAKGRVRRVGFERCRKLDC